MTYKLLLRAQLNVRKGTELIKIIYHTDTAVITKVPQMTGARMKPFIIAGIRVQLKVSPPNITETISAAKSNFDQPLCSQISSLFPLVCFSHNPVLK